MTKPVGSPPLRRSSRVTVRVQVTISGKLPDGKPFSEDTQILCISKYGAKIKAQSALSVGMELKVQPKQRREAGLFRVVWTGREGTPRAGEAGIEYVKVSNLLGVSFP